MKDEVAEIVAVRVCEVVAPLERHGLHRHSILSGVELALRRERERDEPQTRQNLPAPPRSGDGNIH